jgi:predicted DNA-binding transcriptional regulator AlpA
MEGKRYITSADVAQMLGRSEPAVRQMVWRRQLPFRKVAGRIVFVRSEIEKMIEDAPGVRPEELEKVSA